MRMLFLDLKMIAMSLRKMMDAIPTQDIFDNFFVIVTFFHLLPCSRILANRPPGPVLRKISIIVWTMSYCPDTGSLFAHIQAAWTTLTLVNLEITELWLLKCNGLRSHPGQVLPRPGHPLIVT